VSVVRDALDKSDLPIDPAWFSYGTMAPKLTNIRSSMVDSLMSAFSKNGEALNPQSDKRVLSKIIFGKASYIDSFLSNPSTKPQFDTLFNFYYEVSKITQQQLPQGITIDPDTLNILN